MVFSIVFSRSRYIFLPTHISVKGAKWAFTGMHQYIFVYNIDSSMHVGLQLNIVEIRISLKYIPVNSTASSSPTIH